MLFKNTAQEDWAAYNILKFPGRMLEIASS